MADDSSYSGSDRRKEHRRKTNDRRTLIRYEPSKDNRRSGKDRRKSNQDTWKNRDF